MAKPTLLDTRGQAINDEPREDGGGFVSMPLVAGLPGGVFVNLDAIDYAEPTKIPGEGVMVYFRSGKAKKITGDAALSMILALSQITAVTPDPTVAAALFDAAEAQA